MAHFKLWLVRSALPMLIFPKVQRHFLMHVRENGRLTIMFHVFEGPPRTAPLPNLYLQVVLKKPEWACISDEIDEIADDYQQLVGSPFERVLAVLFRLNTQIIVTSNSSILQCLNCTSGSFFTEIVGCPIFFSQPMARLTNQDLVQGSQAGAPLH
jgi:hypothetical protein